jgi:hypothetical protein
MDTDGCGSECNRLFISTIQTFDGGIPHDWIGDEIKISLLESYPSPGALNLINEHPVLIPCSRIFDDDL